MSERERRDYPPATDATICETCGERGHYWCRPSRIVFKGRAVPTVYIDDIEDDEPARSEPGADERRE